MDTANGDTFWRDAIKTEMFNVGIVFEVLEHKRNLPVGWKKTRKARWVRDGLKTPYPDGSTYAGVVSRESVRIALTYAALNGLGV
eukprot:9080794-Ditylum_brightwellii.AAC.1